MLLTLFILALNQKKPTFPIVEGTKFIYGKLNMAEVRWSHIGCAQRKLKTGN